MAGMRHKILKDLVVTSIFAVFIHLLLVLWSGSEYYPAGDTITRFNRILNIHLFHKADALLNMNNIDHYELDDTLYIMKSSTCVTIEADKVMAGAGVWMLWIGLVLLFPSNIKSRILILPVGLLIIYWIMALRMAVLVYAASMNDSAVPEYSEAVIPPSLSIAIPLLWFLLYELSCKLHLKLPSCRTELATSFSYWIDQMESKFDNWLTK